MAHLPKFIGGCQRLHVCILYGKGYEEYLVYLDDLSIWCVSKPVTREEYNEYRVEHLLDINN